MRFNCVTGVRTKVTTAIIQPRTVPWPRISRKINSSLLIIVFEGHENVLYSFLHEYPTDASNSKGSKLKCTFSCSPNLSSLFPILFNNVLTCSVLKLSLYIILNAPCALNPHIQPPINLNVKNVFHCGTNHPPFPCPTITAWVQTLLTFTSATAIASQEIFFSYQ